jgi:putative hydrolase of the HAD superfamily
VILDYGEVLCHRPAPGMMDRMAEVARLDLEDFTARYFRERGLYDRGDLASVDYWHKVVSDSAVLDDKCIDTLRRWDVEMWSDLNREMTAWFHEVHAAGIRTALLSNMHFDMAEHARRSFDWLRQLDHVTLSCEVRMVKPEPGIYKHSVEGLGVLPAEACFIDDREENVLAARDAGLMAIRFQNLEILRRDLTDIGFPVLPGPALN